MYFFRQFKDDNTGREYGNEFLAEVRTKLQKIYFFRQFKEYRNQTNDPIFSSTFSALFVMFISDFGNNQNSFSCGPPFVPFWSVKYPNLCPKATNSDSSLYFSRKQTPCSCQKSLLAFVQPSPNNHFFRLHCMEYKGNDYT